MCICEMMIFMTASTTPVNRCFLRSGCVLQQFLLCKVEQNTLKSLSLDSVGFKFGIDCLLALVGLKDPGSVLGPRVLGRHFGGPRVGV
jgi:hypothetical protein